MYASKLYALFQVVAAAVDQLVVSSVVLVKEKQRSSARNLLWTSNVPSTDSVDPPSTRARLSASVVDNGIMILRFPIQWSPGIAEDACRCSG